MAFVEPLQRESHPFLEYSQMAETAEQVFFNKKLGRDHPLNVVPSTSGQGGTPATAVSEILTMKQEIDDLKRDRVWMGLSVDALKEIVYRYLLKQPADPCCSCSPIWDTGSSVLVLGDGNFSFSFAFTHLMKQRWGSSYQIVASVIEDEESFLRRYQSGHTYLRQLRSPAISDCVQVRFGVDARDLPAEWNGVFSDIVWNFPHPGGKTNLRKSRELLRGALRSIYTILPYGRFHVTFARNQSGLSYTAISSRNFILRDGLPDQKRDSWQVAYLAAEYDFLIQDANCFHAKEFPLYVGSGYKNRDKMFYNDRDAETISLVRCEPMRTLEQFRQLEDNLSAVKLPGYAHELRPFYRHDLSIVYLEAKNVDYWEDIFKGILYQRTGLLLIDILEMMDMRCLDPNGLTNRIYRVTWQCWSQPLSKLCCNDLQEELRAAILSSIASDNLPFALT